MVRQNERTAVTAARHLASTRGWPRRWKGSWSAQERPGKGWNIQERPTDNVEWPGRIQESPEITGKLVPVFLFASESGCLLATAARTLYCPPLQSFMQRLQLLLQNLSYQLEYASHVRTLT